MESKDPPPSADEAFQAYPIFHRSPQIVVSAKQVNLAQELIAELSEQGLPSEEADGAEQDAGH